MSTKPFSFEEAQKPVDPASPATQPKTFSFEEASGVSPDGAFARGWNKTKQSATITGRLLSGDAQGAAQTVKEADDYARRNPGMAEGRDLSAAWQRGDGVMGGISEVAGEFAKDWREAPGVVGGIRATAKNVRAMGEGIVEQVPNMIAPTVGLLGGTAIGGAAGSAAPLVGNVAGGLMGGWAGASAGNALVEGGGMAQEAISKAGINPQDTAAVEKYLKGQGDGILTQAGIKGGIIGAVDVATMGIASKLLNGPARAATTRALADMGVDVANKAAVNAAIKTPEFAAKIAGDATYKAAMTGAGNVARNAGAAALDPAGEFTGELVGQGVATGDWDTKNAALEAFSSIGQSGMMFAGQKAYQAATRPRAGDAAASPEVAQETPPPGLSPEQLAAWNEARLSELQDQEQVEPLGPQSAAPDGRAILDAQRAANRAEMSPDDEIYQSTGYADPSRPRPQFADTIASRLKPSEVMGLNPSAGALSREVAAFVDAQPFTEVTPIEQRPGIGAQRRLGEQTIIDVDAREVIDPQSTIAARLAGPSQAAPLQQAIAQLPYNPATQGDSLADQAPQAIQAATQRTQAGAAQAEPALTDGYGQAWDSLDTETRTSVARSAGARGMLARNVASKGWGDLSPNLRSSISTAIESARSVGAPAIQLGNQPQGASNVGNAAAPQAGSVPAAAGAPNALSQGERGAGLSGNGDGVGGRLDGAGQRVAGAGFGEAGIAPVAGRSGVAPALTQGVAPNVTQAGQAQSAAAGQATPDQGGAGQAGARSQAGGVSAPRPAGVEANGLTTGMGLTVTFGGKTYPVESVSDAQRKWVQFQETAEAGVSQVGNGVEIHDQSGRQVARMSFNGRAWDMNDNLIAESPDTTSDKSRQAPAVPAIPQGNAGNARKKARQHPPTVRGSGALAEVSRALGGISPDLLSDLSEKVVRNRTSKTGKKTQYTSWDNPAIPGVGPLFRKGGTGDIAEVARVLEEAGYLEAGANENDPIGAMQRAQEIIKRELRKGGSTTQVGNADAIDAEMRARLEAEMDAASDPWDDFSFAPDDLEESGYADLSEEVKAATEKLVAEAEAAGIDTETIREDVARQVGEEASQDEYHAATQEALRSAISRAGGNAQEAVASPARAGNQSGGGTAEQAGREGGQGQRQGGPDREALTLEAQTEEDLRAKAEREDAATSEAAAEKAAEQERLRREAEARDNKARADATVDDFQLGQTADQQLSGMDDMFGTPAKEVEAAKVSVDELRQQLRSIEDRIVGAAGLAPGFIEDAMRSRKVPAPLKEQRNALRQQIRDAQGQVDEARANEVRGSDSASSEQPAAQDATPAPATKPTKPTATIEDSGQVLEGARKMYAANYAAKLDEGMGMDVAAVPLSKSWPEPDYQRLLDEGADPWAVAFMHAARDEIPTKPSKGWKLKGWVQKVELLRDLASRATDGRSTTGFIQQTLAKHTGLAGWHGRVELYEAVGHGMPLKGVTLEAGEYGIYGGEKFNPPKTIWAVNFPKAGSSWGNDVATGDTKAEAIEKFKAWHAKQGDAPAKEAKLTSFDIYTYRSKPGVIVGKRLSATKSIDLKTFATVKEAREYKAANQDELERLLAQAKDEPSERRETNAPRVGDDHRNGADVTTEQFRETFGFRGEQFGASMPQGERQANLNMAYDALMDLAGTVGIPPRALSLNGELGLAFGARGHGGKRAFAAHYEADTTGAVTPSRVVINLTRKNGAGSLAHEWFHAVDNYFGRMRGMKAGFLTESYADRGDGVRPEMVGAFRELMGAINRTGMKERSSKLDAARVKDYWSTGLEMAARSFESYVIAKLQDQNKSNDYLANVVNETLYAMQGAYPYPSMGEMTAIRAAFDNFFQTIQTRETEGGNVAMFSRADQAGIPARDSDAQLTAAQQITDTIAARWKNAPADIIVARNMQDASIPEAVRKHDAELKSQGATGEPRGFIYKGKVYLLSDQLKTTSDVIEVLLHESLGHYGLRGVFGDSLKPILQQVGTMRRADVVAKAREYGLFDAENVGENASDRDVWASMTDKQRMDAAEEVLAEMSQTRPDLGFVQRAISAIRNWLRANVPGFQNLRMKNADIVQAYLLPARGWVERGGVSSSVNRQVANEPGSRYSAREQDLLFSGDEAPTSGRPGYETDLFGDPLPISAGRLAPARSAQSGVRGDAQPSTGLSDTAAPEGSYRVRTIIGQEVSRKLGADTILTPEQAAQATAYLYRSAVERFDAIVTDKNGKPLAVVGGFKGALTQASVYPGTVIAEAVRVPGAARIWFSHNHPSGKSALSDADKTLNRTLSSVFDGTSIEPMGTLAVTGKSFEHVSPDGFLTYGATPAPSASINVPVIERELDPGNKDADISLDSPAKAREHGSALYRDAGEPGLMILDAQHRVAAWVPVRGAMKGKLMGSGGLDAVYRAVSESNAGSVIIIHGGELDAGRGDGSVWSIAQNLGAALRGTDVRVLDIIDVNKPRSAAETGANLVAGSVFSRNQDQTQTEFDRGAASAFSDIAEHFERYPSRPPAGMTNEEAKAYLRDRRASMEALVDAYVPRAEGLLMPVRGSGGFWGVTREARPDGDEWRVTRFDRNMEPQGHEAQRSARDAVADVLNWVDPARLSWASMFSRTPAPTSLPAEIEVDGKMRPTTNSNGQPIAATEDGVRNFWAWFGDSKVVDAQGKPLVVYHGTDKKFSKINLKKGAQGIFWFTSDKSAIESGESGAAASGVIMELYAKIENPANWEQYDQLMLDEFKSRKLDGAILPESDGAMVGFIIDAPTQIKSATGNNGNFDLADPDIRFSRTATDQTQTEAFKLEVTEDADGETIYGITVHSAESGGNAFVQADSSPDGLYTINESGVPDDQRGKGLGVALYERLIEEVQKRGGRVASDGSVSKDAQRVYASLEKRGYAVTQSPDAEIDPDDGSIATPDGSPVYEISGGPRINFSRTSTATGTQSAWNAPTPTGFDDVIRKLQDKNIDAKRVIEAITKSVGKVADAVNVYLQEELFHGRAASRVAEFGARELKPMLNQMKLAGLTMDEVEEFLHARHAKEANAVIAQRNPGDPGMQDGGSGMTNADADAYFAKLPASQRSKLEAIAKRVDAMISDTRKLYVQYGLEDQAVVDGWTGMFKNYIPLMRENKDGGMGIGQGFSVKGKEVKGRTGSKRKVVDILANIAAQREKVIVRGEKNRVSQALVGLAWANPNKGFWEVRSQAPTERVYDEKLKRVVDRPDPMFKSRDNVVGAKVKDSKGNVTEQFVVFNEDNPRAVRMAAAMKNLDAGNLEGLLGVSAKITRYFSAINTQYNPVFGVVNLVRDVQGAMVNLAATPLAGQQAKIAKDTVSALAGIYGDIRKTRKGGMSTSKWAQLWEQMQEDGGTTGYRELFKTSADRGESLKAIINPDAWMDSKWGKVFTADGKLKVPMSVAKEKAGDLFNWLSDYNEAMENGVRLAAYKAALDKGMSRQQAASLSKNLTVNFNRKGQVGMQAGAVYAFFNAAMQGTARIGQTLFDMDGGDIKTLRLSGVGKKVVYGGVLLGVMQALALSAAGFDDEDPPEFLRERSLIIPTGGKTYISIPMPLGLHVIPGLGRHATEFALSGFSKPAERAVSVVGMFADAFNPIGNAGLSMQTIAPTALDPFVALSENRDWTGRPIARTSFNKAEPGHNQWKDTATGLSKTIAEAINWLSGGNEYVAGAFSPTPDQIDYLIAQVGGGVAREVSKVMQTGSSITSGEELPTYKMPLLGRFVGSANGQASQGSAFYANLNKLNALETEIKGLRKDGKHDEAAALVRERPESSLIAFANKAERDVQKLRRDKRELIASDADRNAVRAKEDQITAVMTRLNELTKKRTESAQ